MRTSVTRTAAILAALVTSAWAPGAAAQNLKVVVGISGWTGFAPLTLAHEAGLFKKRGLDVEIKMIPSKDRHLALASKSIDCAATTVEGHVTWNTNGVPIVQIFQMDKSYGADGLAVRKNIQSIADLKGKTVGVDAAGTSPFFGLAWMLRKNGMSMKDVKLATLSPQAAAQAFVAGQNDAAFSYEPYLSTVRDNPNAGKILATTVEYPMVMDTMGCSPTWLKGNRAAAQAMTEGYFDALDMIAAEPAKSHQIMGAAVKQSGEEFAKSASYLRWADRASNKKFFADELQPFMREAAVILKESGVIRKLPEDYASMFDNSFIK